MVYSLTVCGHGNRGIRLRPPRRRICNVFDDRTGHCRIACQYIRCQRKTELDRQDTWRGILSVLFEPLDRALGDQADHVLGSAQRAASYTVATGTDACVLGHIDESRTIEN